MRFDKWKCDGCGKEANSPAEFEMRLTNRSDDRGRTISKATLETADIKVSIPADNSLDFCTVTCLELYLANLKLAQEEPLSEPK
jgi:hypothetical protein